jgi:phosphopantothenoylcysteine decarboxylase/phosphopantothenate--cysteine ligase
MGGNRNTVHLLSRNGDDIEVDSWPVMTKEQVAVALIAHIAEHLQAKNLQAKSLQANSEQASSVDGENIEDNSAEKPA